MAGNLVFDHAGWLDLRETFAEFRKAAPDRKVCAAALLKRFQVLHSVPSGLKGKTVTRWKANRGYELERILIAEAAAEGLDPRSPYKLPGEQIDGLFFLDGRPFLVEAKWQEKEASAADVYAFQGKLHGKLLGTLGLFVSVGGFAREVSDVIRYGKGVDVLMAGATDIEYALSAEYSLADVVRAKLREAAATGVVDYQFQRWLDLGKP